jgi:hypothetical protein
MKTRTIIIFSITILISAILSAQSTDIRFSPIDKQIFEEKIEYLLPYKNSSMPTLVTEVALSFLGTPYTAGTLEQIPETLTINLHETDCILFVESCIAMALTIKQSTNPEFEEYCTQVRKMRYRDGIVEGYESRIHYTSEWLIQNEKNNILVELSSRYGERFDQHFSYMSTHPQSYKQLRDSDDMVRRIALIEERLNSSAPFYYISNKKLRSIENEILSGDIIGFISNVEGLDIAHVAIAYHDKGELHFIHASFKEKKVVIEKKKLVDYASNGIRVARLK